jgi:hypothetical protein
MSRNGLSDASASLVLEQLQRMDLRVERLRLSGNAIEAKGLAKVTEYIWNCPEALLELDVSKNRVEADPSAGETPGSDGVSALLRCLYNHAKYPQIVTGQNGAAQVLPLVLHLGGNRIKEPAKLLKNIEAKGGKKHVKIRPSPEPYEHVGKEYLSICLPEFLDQAVPETRERHRKRNRSRSGHKERKRAKVTLTPAAAKGVEKPKKSKKSKKEPEHWRPASPQSSEAGAGAGASSAARSGSASPAPAPAKKEAVGASTPKGSRSALLITDEEQRGLQREVGEKIGSFAGLPSEDSTRDMLSEFVVCMAVAGKGSEEIKKELQTFMPEEASAFAKWFSHRIKKLKRK